VLNMEKKSIEELTGRGDFLKQVLIDSASLTKYVNDFEDKEKLNYYKSFPDIADKHNKLQKQLSNLIGRIGGFVGVEHGKGLVSMDKTV
jgi:hypothetical protein